MLIDEPRIITQEVADNAIFADMDDCDYSEPVRLEEGIYQRPGFGYWPFMTPWDDWQYGVCDSFDQVLARFPEIRESECRRFMVALTVLKKANQPSLGGWRWHPWGCYIGTQNPCREYLYDEPVIEQVMVFHVYQDTSDHIEINLGEADNSTMSRLFSNSFPWVNDTSGRGDNIERIHLYLITQYRDPVRMHRTDWETIVRALRQVADPDASRLADTVSSHL